MLFQTPSFLLLPNTTVLAGTQDKYQIALLLSNLFPLLSLPECNQKVIVLAPTKQHVFSHLVVHFGVHVTCFFKISLIINILIANNELWEGSIIVAGTLHDPHVYAEEWSLVP